jgi:hypothetical protein
MKIFSPNIEYKFDLSIIDENGAFVTGLTIAYEIRDVSDNGLVTSGTMTPVGDLYVITYTFTEVGQYRILYYTPEGYENGNEEVLVSSLATQISKIYEIETGRWKILNNQMIIYASDNITEIARFNLFDLEGNPSITDVVERVKV